MKKYLCHYRFEGNSWGFEISAESWDEAERKLKEISRGKVIGHVAASPIEVLADWFKGLMGIN